MRALRLGHGESLAAQLVGKVESVRALLSDDVTGEQSTWIEGRADDFMIFRI